MTNFVLILIICALVGAALVYIYRAKRSGQACVGCPYGKQCASGRCTNCIED